MKTQIAGTRHDHKTGQYFPTINGKDTSPSSFDETRALEIATEQINTPRKTREVKCFGSDEIGPFAELNDGSRLRGSIAHFPALRAALIRARNHVIMGGVKQTDNAECLAEIRNALRLIE